MSGAVQKCCECFVVSQGDWGKDGWSKGGWNEEHDSTALAALKCSMALLKDSKSEDSKPDARRWREPVPEPLAPCLKLAQPCCSSESGGLLCFWHFWRLSGL